MSEGLERQVHGDKAIDNGSSWDSVAEMAGKMGEISEETKSSLEEKQEQALDVLIQVSREQSAEKLEEFKRRSADLWSREFALKIMKTLGNEAEDDSYSESGAWCLTEIGMPVRVVLENDDFYQDMLTHGGPPASPGLISQFYQEMSRYEGGGERFRHDFIESGSYEASRSGAIEQLYRDGEIDDASLSDLKLLKQFGVQLFDTKNQTGPIPSAQFEDEEAEIEEGKRVYKATSLLIDNGLFDGKDFESLVEGTLESGYCTALKSHILEAALDNKIEVQSENPDVKYWVDLSRESGQDMLRKFIVCADSQRQEDFDFSQESVMRLFLNVKRKDTFGEPFLSYQSPKFREALQQPVFQELIIKTIDEEANRQKENNQPLRTPSLLLFLAQDRQIIEGMRERGVFDQHPDAKEYEAVQRLSSDDYSEKDRLSLFVKNDVPDYDSLFDENGEPGRDFYSGLYYDTVRIPSEVLTEEERDRTREVGFEEVVKNDSDVSSIWFDAQEASSQEGLSPQDSRKLFWKKCFEAGKIDFIVKHHKERASEMGFDKMTDDYLSGLSGNVFSDEKKVVDKSNVVAALVRFIKMDAEDWDRATEDDLIIKEAFSGSEAKDLALRQLRKEYEQFLGSEEKGEFPHSLRILVDHMRKNDGAGPLTQIEAFLDFAGGLSNAGERNWTLTQELEERMAKERWDNQEKTQFYAISAEVLQASPDLYQEFAELFTNLPSKEEFKTFATEVYPLFRAKLALLRIYEDHSNGVGSGYTTVKYNPEDIKNVKSQLHNALLPFNLQELPPDKRKEGIEHVKKTIFGEISGLFQSKFSLSPKVIPAEFSKQDARVIEDMTLYLGNMASPNTQKSNLVGYYLALQFNSGEKWDALRNGVQIDPREIMSDIVSAFGVENALEVSRRNDPLTSENIRITSPERLSAFRRALQSETSFLHLDDIQTVDVKLQNLIGGLGELTDPDLYPEEIDKQRVELLGRHHRLVGKVAAGMMQRSFGKGIRFTEEEQQVEGEMIGILEKNGIEVTPDNIKRLFQDEMKTLKMPFDKLSKIEKDGTREAIQELQTILVPPAEIIQIFNRLGESFNTASGVMALSEDLDYLENLVVKKEGEISEEEKGIIRGYIGQIRDKVTELEKRFNGIVGGKPEQFIASLPGGVSSEAKKIVDGLDRTINRTGERVPTTTTCTDRLTVISENMRACLSCRTKGINNDTNLTFGEGYKFYLYSANNISRESSNADEIVYFIPSGGGEDRRMSFVMDQLYGTKNRDTLVGHVETIIKKARDLKRQFPEAPISIIIPKNTFSSCSVASGARELRDSLGSQEGMMVSDVTGRKVNVPESGFGDHYIEFENNVGPRAFGEREINGVEIILLGDSENN